MPSSADPEQADLPGFSLDEKERTLAAGSANSSHGIRGGTFPWACNSPAWVEDLIRIPSAIYTFIFDGSSGGVGLSWMMAPVPLLSAEISGSGRLRFTLMPRLWWTDRENCCSDWAFTGTIPSSVICTFVHVGHAVRG